MPDRFVPPGRDDERPSSMHSGHRASEPRRWRPKGLCPFPLDTADLRGRGADVARIIEAAGREVGVRFRNDDDGTMVRFASGRGDDVMKATAVAFDSLGIAYEWVTGDEYVRRLVAAKKKPGGCLPHLAVWWEEEAARA